MKKIVFLALFIIVTTLSIDAQIVNIPDANFKAVLVADPNIDTSGDGEIQIGEAVGYTGGIYAFGQSISDLTGIDAFSSITLLNVNDNQLQSLDVSNNSALENLLCDNNQLTSLDISSNGALKSLFCENNLLNGLDVSNHIALEDLYCSGNQLINLNASNCTALTMLRCWNNQLTSLNVSNCTALVTLRCYENQLSNLDVSNYTSLETIDCHNNQLSNLNVSNCISLLELNCWDNQLNNIDVSTNTALQTLDIMDNQLTSINVTGNTALTGLFIDDNLLTNIDVSNNLSLLYLSFENNQLVNIDVSNNIALDDLNCSFNPLISLNISSNTALANLVCQGISLTSLDVTFNTGLTSLYCENNLLASLDISNNTALKDLSCSNNQLTSLDVSNNVDLEELYCNNNQLTNLNIKNGNNINLTGFDATNNPNLTCIQVDDVAFMNTNYAGSKDAGANYSLDCKIIEITISNVIENNTTFPTPLVLWHGISNTPAPVIKLCADGSKATRIVIINKTGINSNDIRFRMVNDPNELYPDSLGRFTITQAIVDTIYATFEHPKFLSATVGLNRVDSFRIFDINNPFTSLYTIPVNIYRAPVIMVHGLWGSEESFEKMEDSLDLSGLYPAILTENSDYFGWNNKSFDHNKSVVPSAINFIFNKLRNDSFSTGKVDIITHSMGGLLARGYLQSNAYQLKQDIHKFIPLNAPQSGSQIGNLMTNTISNTAHMAQFIALLFANPNTHFLDIYGGAVEDLAINSNAMQLLNDTANLAKGHVPTHAICTEASVNNYTGNFIHLLPGFYRAFALAAQLSTQLCLDYLFVNQQNDFAVSIPSQSGGLLPSAVSLFNSQMHIGSTENGSIQAETLKALNTNSADSIYFNQNGFSPVPQQTNYKQPNIADIDPLNQIIPGSLLINSPIAGQYFNPGDVISVDITSTNGINRILFVGANFDDKAYVVDTNMSNVIVNYIIPQNAFGKIKLIAFGYDTSGLIGFDTLQININQTATLDSFICNEDTIRVQVNNIKNMSLKAYFSNGYNYHVNNSNGVQYQIADTSLVKLFQSDILWGKQVGTTSIAMTYLGQTITLPLVVFPEDTTIHIDTTFAPTTIREIYYNTRKAHFLEIYPNPTNGIFNIKFDTNIGEEITVEIFDQLGKKVLLKKEKATGKIYLKELNLKDYYSGLYYIKVTTKHSSYGGRVTLANY